MWRFISLTVHRKRLVGAFIISFLLILASGIVAGPMILYSEQKHYKDTIIYSSQTRYQKIVMTQWKNYYWLYINGQEQFSTYDEERYHEPLVHPAMQLAGAREQILILGGGDGLAAREVLKYPDVSDLTLVDLDPAMTDLATHHPVLKEINHHSMSHDKITIKNMDGAIFIRNTDRLFDVIIIDLPDPDSMDIMHLYSLSFYREVEKHLTRQGVMVTQATSPYFSKKAFLCIYKTIQASGMVALPLHNQVPTLGEWGWIIAVKPENVNNFPLTFNYLDNDGLLLNKFNNIDKSNDTDNNLLLLKKKLLQLSLDTVQTRFINRDALISMIHFGKDIFNNIQKEEVHTENLQTGIEINRQDNPVLFKYYHQGQWGVY
ncbi:Spermidine synthase (fragment) [Desulfamplus magnetovallimortis]|uniref:Polyamine aminopropyltransferase n=2 Tax=Desulfamplus magnetovallimortis TaxID=1246637 RepID=A0A1W1HEA6_9BACT